MISSVTPPELVCAECGRRSDAEARGWQGYLVDADEGGGDEVLFFCPRFANREFGDLRRGWIDPPSPVADKTASAGRTFRRFRDGLLTR